MNDKDIYSLKIFLSMSARSLAERVTTILITIFVAAIMIMFLSAFFSAFSSLQLSPQFREIGNIVFYTSIIAIVLVVIGVVISQILPTRRTLR